LPTSSSTCDNWPSIDPVIVLRVLQTDIADIERFRDAVLRVI
jgi:hypothetical protein